MLKTYVQKVREKSPAKRKALLFGWTAGLTALIAFVWFVNFTVVSYNTALENERLLAEAEKKAEAGIVAVEEKAGPSFAESAKENLAAVGEGGKIIFQSVFNLGE